MSLTQGNNTPTRPRMEPGSPNPESNALTTRPVRSPTKVYVEPPWEVEKKAYVNGTGHMTKMVAMLIYGKNFQKLSPTELIRHQRCRQQ